MNKGSELSFYKKIIILLFSLVLSFISFNVATVYAGIPGTLKWKVKVNGIQYSPAIGSDGTIYVDCNDIGNYLCALKPDGTTKWKFDKKLMNGWIVSSPAIGSDGTIYVGPKNLYAINKNGILKWKYSPIYNSKYDSVTSSPIIDSDGTIYIGTFNGYIYAINQKGGLKWKTKISSNPIRFSPSISSDGTIYTGSDEGYLYAIYPDGTIKWKRKISLYGYLLSSPSISSDGTIYISSDEGYLYAIYPDGTIKWKRKIPLISIFSGPAIDINGTIYVGCADGYLYAINPDGTLKWKYETKINKFGMDSFPSIASDGTIYVGCADGYLYAINPDGTLKWKYETNYNISSHPTIDYNGTIYISSDNGYLYAIYSDSQGPSNSMWPMFNHDLRHTGRVDSDNQQVDKIPPTTPGGFHVEALSDTQVKLSWESSTDNIKVEGYNIYNYQGDKIASTHSLNYIISNLSANTSYCYSISAYDQSGNESYITQKNCVTTKNTKNPDGTLKWKFQAEDSIESSPAIGLNGAIYVGSKDNNLYAINQDGTLKWKYETTGSIVSSPAIGSDGTIFVGSDNGFIYGVNSSSGGVAFYGWAKFHRNNQNIGNISYCISYPINNNKYINLSISNGYINSKRTKFITFKLAKDDKYIDTINMPSNIKPEKVINIIIDNVSKNVDIVIHNLVLPANYIFYKYSQKQWIDLSNNKACNNCNFKCEENQDGTYTISFTIADGGILDSDGDVNGMINDPIVIGKKPIDSSQETKTNTDMSGGGCTTSTSGISTGLIFILITIIGFMFAKKI